MPMTNRRNLETADPPAFAAHVLVLGDSTARAGRTGALAGAMLEEIDELAGLGGPVKLHNAGFGGYKLLDSSGASRFLNFADLADADGMTAARAIMGNAPSLDAAVILIGANDLADVEPATGAVAGYDQARIEAGLAQLVANIRTEASEPALPVVLVIPGRDRSNVTKGGGGQTWRRAAVTFAASDANVHPVDSYDLPLEDSVHRDQAGDQALGFRIGRLIAKHAFAAPGVGGPPVVQSVAKTSPTSVRVVVSTPPNENLTHPEWPSAWRATDEFDQSELRIARAAWIDANEFDLVLHDGATGNIRIQAPYDLAQGFSADGLIRTAEGDNDHEPGYALQSFEGVAS